jgi:hypothetical protein
LAPDGNNEAEYKHLVEEIDKWSDNIRSGHLPRRLVWESFTTGLLKKLEYPLPATTFTKAECDAMQSRILCTALPYSGVVRSFPRVVVHGPKRYLGLAIPHLYTTQGIQQVMRAVIFSSAKRSSGHLFRCSAETMKLEKGMNGPLLSPDFYSYDAMITESWWKALWGFLARYGMSMHDDIPDFPLY